MPSGTLLGSAPVLVGVALLLGLVNSAPGSVKVQVKGDVDTSRVRAALIERLLEEGYVLAPERGPAGLKLVVVVTQDLVRLDAVGLRTIHQEIPRDDSALSLLEIHQAAVLSLEQAGPTPGAPLPRTVCLSDLRASGSASLLAQLRQRLLSEGFGLVGAGRPRDVEVCLSAKGAAIMAAASAASCARLAPTLELSAAADEDPERFEARLAQAVVVLARGVSAEPTRGQPNLSLRPNPGPPPPSELSVALHAGALARGAVDPSVALSARYLWPLGLGASAMALISPSGASGEGQVVESSFLLGPTLRRGFGEDFAASLSALGGVCWHHFAITGAASGDRADWSLLGNLAMSYRLGAGLELELGLYAGLGGRAREHRVNGALVWERQAWMASLMLDFRYAWPI